MEINREFAKKWAEDLEDENNIQTKYMMYDSDTGGHCCLGRAIVVMRGMKLTSVILGGPYDYDRYDLLNIVGMDDYSRNLFITLNDILNLKLPEIAKHVRIWAGIDEV